MVQRRPSRKNTIEDIKFVISTVDRCRRKLGERPGSSSRRVLACAREDLRETNPDVRALLRLMAEDRPNNRTYYDTLPSFGRRVGARRRRGGAYGCGRGRR
jgi:hypothetical protein